MASLAQIQDWWDANVVPIIAQRLETFASFRHKDDAVPLADVDGLANALNGKAAASDLASLRDTVNGINASNLLVESILEMLAIESPQNGFRVNVKSYHNGFNKGGGFFIYDNEQSDFYDGGVNFNGWVRILTSDITVEDFGAKGYPYDDMAAFQRASNYLYLVGGGILKLTQKKYYISQYTGADVNGMILFSGPQLTDISKAWLLPPNCTIEGGGAQVHIEGGTSPLYGIISILAYCGNETPYPVTSAINNTSTVYLSNTNGLLVGDKVQLCRGINDGVSTPSTPSQERSPNQFLTIKSIVENTSVTFVDGFIHNFEAVSDLLTIYKTNQLSKYPENIFINNLHFISNSTVANIPYILFSRLVNTGLKNVTFDGIAFTFAQCMKVRCGKFTINPKHNVESATIEGCSDVTIDSFEANGNGTTNGLGGLFLTDNCRLIKIARYVVSNYQKTGFAALYSVDAEIEQMTLINCGTNAVPEGFSAAVTVGFPAFEAIPPQFARLNYVLMRNLGVCKVKIKSLIIKGLSTLPVRAHDVDLTIDNAYVEFSSTSGLHPFFVGQSGTLRSDPTYFPKGGQLNLKVGNLEIKTISGTPKEFAVSALNGSTGFFKNPNTIVNGNVIAGSSTITVNEGKKIKKGHSLKWISNTIVQGGDVLDVIGNVITLSSPISIDIANGAPLWSVSDINPVSGESVNIEKLVIDGISTPPNNSFDIIYPEYAGGLSPFTSSFNLTVPSDGEWILSITNISDDKAHYEQKEYLVTYYNGVNPLSGIVEKTDTRIRANATVDSATITDNIVTVIVGSYNSGKNGSVIYNWVQVRKVAF